jgi:signal transduction histidine kinase
MSMNATLPEAVASPVPRRQGWLLAFGFWTAVAGVFALSQLAKGGGGGEVLLSSLAQWWPWGLLAPVINRIDRRLPFAGNQMGRRIVAHLLLGPLLVVVYGYVSAVLAAAMHLQPWSALSHAAVVVDTIHGLFWSMLVYGLIVGVCEAYAYQQRYVSAAMHVQRLERNFSEARLNALRTQLDPHFLFNALNTISAQLEREPKLARTMIEHLGDLLRLSLAPQSRQEVRLTEELAFLDHYLAIQTIRFGDQLKVNVDVSDEVKSAIVPSMFLQPLVENAIRHGLSPRARGGTITLIAERLGQQLHIQVLDDGVGLPANWQDGSRPGVGLSVTRERIAGYADGSSRFAIARRHEGGTEVDIRFPLRLHQVSHDRNIA